MSGAAPAAKEPEKKEPEKKEKKDGKSKEGKSTKTRVKKDRDKPPVRGASPVRKEALPVNKAGDAEVLNLVIAGDEDCDIPGLLNLYCTAVPIKAKAESPKSFEPKIVGMVPDEADPVVNVTLLHEPTPRTTQLVTADAVLLCYTPVLPATLRESVSNAWLPLVRKAAPNAVIGLCATRMDFLRKAVKRKMDIVKAAEAADFCVKQSLHLYHEASAKNNKGVRSAIEEIVKIAYTKRKGTLPLPYAATEAEIKRIKDIRTEVKSAPVTSVWTQINKNGRYYYRNRKTKATKSSKPADFDGIDFEQQAKDEIRNMRVSYITTRETTDVEQIASHSERIASFQAEALHLVQETNLLRAEVTQLRNEETLLERMKTEWQTKQETIEKAIQACRGLKDEEELAHEEERNEKKQQEEACRDTEKDLLEHRANFDTTQIKQKKEANHALALQLMEIQNSRVVLTSRQKEVESLVNNGLAKNAKTKASIENWERKCNEAKDVSKTLAASTDEYKREKRLYQNGLARAKDEEISKVMYREHKEQEEENLARVIDKLEMDIMSHKDPESLPPAHICQAQYKHLKEEKGKLVRELASKCAADLERVETLVGRRNTFLEKAQYLDEAYSRNGDLLQAAAPLPLEVIKLFARYSAALKRRAARMEHTISMLECNLLRQQRERRMDVHEMLKLDVPLEDDVDEGTVTKMRQALQSCVRKYTKLDKKIQVCEMEHAYLQRVLMTRTEDRVRHNEAAQQLVAHINSELKEVGSPPAWKVKDFQLIAPSLSSAVQSMALKCSQGILSETRADLVAAEAFVVRRKLRKRVVTAEETRENMLYRKSLGKTKKRASETRVTRDTIHTFASTATELIKKTDRDVAGQFQGPCKQLPYPISASGLEFPTKLEYCVTNASPAYRTAATETWLGYAQGQYD